MRLIKVIVFAVILSIVVYYAPAVLTTFTITSPAVKYEAANVTRALGPIEESDENVTVQSTPLLQVYREESGNAEYMQVYVYNLTLSLAVTLAVFIMVRRIRRAYS